MKEAWTRWGEADEAGALNRVTPKAVIGAAGLVSQGRVISLAQPISRDTPVPGHRAGVMHFMGRDGGDYPEGRRRPGGFQFAEDTIVMPLHVGTHIDALCHCWYDDTLYNGFACTEVRSSGSARLGADKLPPVATRGLLLDFVALNGSPLEDGAPIGLGMLREAISHGGAEPGEGDAILLRTGWQERQDSGESINYNTEPGLNEEAALFLAETGVAIVGADNYAVEVLPFAEGTVFPVHQRLIRDYGIPLMEGLVLEPLAREGVSQFLFVCAPLPIKGGTGSPLNPLAIL